MTHTVDHKINPRGFASFSDNNQPADGTYGLPPGTRLASMREAGLADDQPVGTKPAPGVRVIQGNSGQLAIYIYDPSEAGVPGDAPGGTIAGVNAGGTGTGAGPGVGAGRSDSTQSGPVFNTLKSPVPEKITISNPLHQFASYSYAISLWKLSLRDFNLLMANTGVEGAMTWQPTVGGLPIDSSFVVAEDSGLYPDYRVPNTYGFNYNIEDLAFTSILVKQKGASSIEGSLTVVEPIGCTFLDLLVEASWNGKEYINYTQQPYMIQIDFKGYDDNGNEIPKSEMKLYRKRLPIKLLTVDISVDKQGSKYVIKFCPTGAAVFLPDQMPIPVDMSITVKTVKEFFDQLGKKLNEASADLIPAAANYANEYKFVVDKTIGNSNIVDETWMKFTEAETKAGRSKGGLSFTKQTFSIPAKSNLLNVIGRMMMQADFFTTLQDIGEVHTNRITKLDQIYNTFKITAKTEYQGLNSDGQRQAGVFDDKTGSMPRKYTIYINQYSVYQNPHPRGNNALVDASLYAIKKYDYIYTGKNLDIMDLNLTFNTTYYTAFMTNPFNIASTEVGPGTKLAENVASKTRDIIVHPGTIFSQLKKLANPTPAVFRGEPTNPATADKNPNVQTAKDIARSLPLFQKPNSADMIVCHLGIVGDPTLIKQDDWLYTPDPTAGGDYNASTSQATFASTHGHVRMDTAEVVVELNVNTPLDMDMDIEGGYGNQGLYFPGPGVYRSLFSGTYQIIIIKNNFSKGIFTQKLEMVRYINDTLVKEGAKVVDAVGRNADNGRPSLQVNGA